VFDSLNIYLLVFQIVTTIQKNDFRHGACKVGIIFLGGDMKIYKLEHLKSKKQFHITAENFDDAVRRTFDECISNWICKGVVELDHAFSDLNPMALDLKTEEDLKEWMDFLDQLAHDMANPMSFLEQYIDKISKPKEEFMNDEAELSEAARCSYRKVRGLLDQLRNYIKAGELEMGCSDFVAVIERCLSEIKGRALEAGAEISYVGPKHLIGKFDEKMLERVIANLCANAIEAMERNGGKIEISLLHNDKTVWIEVADTGKGIPENLLDRVFDSGSTFGKKNGTGLGLSFCKKIVMAHGGKVSVYSREGEGTVFSLVFPLAAVLKTEWLEVGDRLGLKTVLFCDACECDKWVYDFYDEKLAGLTSVSEIHSKNASDNQAEFTLDPL